MTRQEINALADLRERVVRLEAMAERQKETSHKVDEMHELLLKAKGAKWALILLLTLGSSTAGFLAAKLSALTSLIR